MQLQYRWSTRWQRTMFPFVETSLINCLPNSFVLYNILTISHYYYTKSVFLFMYFCLTVLIQIIDNLFKKDIVKQWFYLTMLCHLSFIHQHPHNSPSKQTIDSSY